MNRMSQAAKWVHIVAAALLVVGGLVWGLLGLTGFNLVRFLVGRRLAPLLYILVGIAAIYLATQMAFYLPFLGETVMPCSILSDRSPEHADTEVSLHGQRPGAKILFWAAEPATAGLATIKSWRQAYLDYSNAGVTTVDAGGHATLRIRKPQPYTVPIKGQLQTHVHWRSCEGEGGMLGPVQTTTVSAI
jgi:uncharacterized membrane protein YuzA (DUF378 family)